jgi:carbonic anhydrase
MEEGCMVEIAWRYHPDTPLPVQRPATPEEARQVLLAGNRAFAGLGAAGGASRLVIDVAANNLGMREPGAELLQQPLAAVMSCADARVPLELITGQAADGLFVVRVAGNLPGTECIGSLDYAVDNLHSIRLLVTLGHTGCGALTTAVDAYLSPGEFLGAAANLPLRAIIDGLLPAVRSADITLVRIHGEQVRSVPGYRSALIELSVVINAALTSMIVHTTFQSRLHANLGVAFGVYNLENRLVGLPDGDGWTSGLFDPPLDRPAFMALNQRIARSAFVAGRL